MRLSRFLLAAAALAPAGAPARAGEPLTVEVRDRAAVGAAVVTVGDVAAISGGDAATRAWAARLDLAELKGREAGTTIGRRSVDYRLVLAGIDARVSGAERTTVTLARRAVTADEVTAAARAELLRYYGPATGITAELALPVVVRLPEVPVGEPVAITGKPRGGGGALGRVQMDMSVAAAGETLLSFPVHFEVRGPARPDVLPVGGSPPYGPVYPAGGVQPAAGIPPLVGLQPAGGVQPVAGVQPAASGFQPFAAGVQPPGALQPAAGEVVIRPRQRVWVQVNSGPLRVMVVGEAQQAGRLGQTIQVQNVDSKKVLTARVTGPGLVDLELGLGGAP